LGAACIAAAGGCAHQPASQVDQVRQVLDQQVADWNEGDLEGFLRGYWQDDRLTFSAGGVTTRGFEEVARRYRQKYGSGDAMGTLAFRNLEIEALGADAAFVYGRWSLQMANGEQPGGVFTLVLRRRSGAWMIVHDHTTQRE
jgi:beta-aspartyl-peptidase (threonine type)